MDPRTERELRRADPEFARIVGRLPSLASPPLPPDWLVSEMVERYQLLGLADLRPGQRVVEIGSGAHALATVPIAVRVRERGRVVAVERARWQHFREVVRSSGLGERIDPVRADARRLPIETDAAGLAVCVHGVRSLGNDAECVRVFREMLRIAPRLFVAESLPVARTPAQRAHLAMYALREEVFLATTGRRDDLGYRPLEELGALVERAGGAIDYRGTLEVDLPHALAYFPRSSVESVRDPAVRARLGDRWDTAARELRRWGEDHPPIGVVVATRASDARRRRSGSGREPDRARSSKASTGAGSP